MRAEEARTELFGQRQVGYGFEGELIQAGERRRIFSDVPLQELWPGGATLEFRKKLIVASCCIYIWLSTMCTLA